MYKQNVTITGTGHALGAEIITNDFLAARLGVAERWIFDRTGIKERRRAAREEYTSTLAVRAARRALEQSNLEAGELDLIICATVTPDFLQMPATACIVQAELGAKKAASFDLAAACTGFIYALDAAQKFVSSGAYKNVLIIGADLMTRCVDEADAHTAILFADGAGAAIVSAAENGSGILSTDIGSNGAVGDLIYTPAGGTRQATSCETVRERLHFMKMRGREIFKIAVAAMPCSSKIALERAGLTLADVDLIIPHQANQRIIDAIAARLEITSEKVFTNIEKIGNTGAATVPIALDQCLRSGRIKSGDTVLLTAFGGGITWGSAVIKF